MSQILQAEDIAKIDAVTVLQHQIQLRLDSESLFFSGSGECSQFKLVCTIRTFLKVFSNLSQNKYGYVVAVQTSIPGNYTCLLIEI